MSGCILIAAALGLELRPLARRLGRVRKIKGQPFDARAARIGDREVVLVRTGIGRIEVDRILPQAVEAFRPLRICNIGLAGALRPEFRVGDPFLVASACSWPGAAETLGIERALELEEVYRAGESAGGFSQPRGAGRVRRARLLSVDELVTGLAVKRRLAAAGFDLVDMELAAAARCAAGAGAGMTGFKVVSDSLRQRYSGFSFSVSEGAKGLPPPSLALNSMRAAGALAKLTLAWLRSEASR